MHTSIMKTVAVGAMLSASMAFGAIADKASTFPELNKKNDSLLKNGSKKRVIFDSLKGASEKTQLPDTARSDDARGGILI